MEFKTTRIYKDLVRAWVEHKRRFMAEGGTSSSKTYSILQFLITLAREAKEPLLISIVSESLPHLKRGCIRDFFNILGESTENNPYWSKTEFIYSRPDWKGRFEFFGADDSSKARGPRRQILFINEANNVIWETARNLDIRTSMFTVIDWNPVSEFWAHEFWLNEPDNAYSHSTYLDAKDAGVLPEQVIKDIESYREKDPNWWNVYGLGLVGRIEGLVHPSFMQVDGLPPMGTEFYGLDWGFASDPTVLVKNVVIGDKLYSKQMFYDFSALTNGQIAQRMTLLGVDTKTPIYADPDEPKSIEEISKMGFNILEGVKGPGSVEYGTQRVNQFYQYWTKDSIDCIKEQRNFRYIKKVVQGREIFTDETTHQYSHGMSARRYGVATFKMRTSPLQPLKSSYSF
ncbi:MAG: phage terminase large subunit [Candidatus Omnitrophota bacterium]